MHPPTYASCPQKGKILEYYAGQFEAVYILLHPFIRPTQLDIERFYPETYPSKLEILQGTEPILWKRIQKELSLDSLAPIDVALRTMIHALRREVEDKVLAKGLLTYLDERGLVMPGEGYVPAQIENGVYEALMRLGYESIWLGDEFGTEQQQYRLKDLLQEDNMYCHGCAFTNNHKILLTTHWDSHCSYLCSSQTVIEQILRNSPMEGFYCSQKTEVYWGLYEI